MKRPRLLIIGCGDIGQRVVRQLARRWRLLALARSEQSASQLRQLGVTPLHGDLDQRRSLHRLRGLASHLLHLAPPATGGTTDRRTQRLLAAIRQPQRRRHQTQPTRQNRPIVAPRRLLYISTSGVYGDCGGAWVTECRPRQAQSERAQRRASAEDQVRALGRCGHWQTRILRVPGIHGPDRLPLQRLRGGQPVMLEAEDSWGNHVGADDLARAIGLLLRRGHTQRVYNVCDSDPLPMSVYLNRLCAALGLPPLPQVTREQARQLLSPTLWSYQRESRRLSNQRLQDETGWRPQLATVDDLVRRLPVSPA